METDAYRREFLKITLVAGGLAIAIGSILSLVGGILPAYRAAKMEPVDAMRLEV